MELEFRHLRVVLALVDTGSLTGAAAQLGITQPAVSESLRRAERVAGGALFQRGAHGATPTPLGELVAAHARNVLDSLARLKATGSALRLSCTPCTLQPHLVVVAAEALGTAVDVRATPARAAPVELVADGRAHAVLATDFPGHEHPGLPGVRRTPVADEPLFVAVAEDGPAAGPGEAALAELADLTWAVTSAGDHRRAYLLDVLTRAGIRARVRTVDFGAAYGLVELGRVVLPVMPGTRPRAGIALRALAGTPLVVRTSLFWRADGPLRPDDVRSLRDRLADAQHTLVERTPPYREWLADHPDWRTTPSA
ncbi:LysR family transcriptional regulator [Actinomadura decatromicini]|uniref:LysR family transcriptional regulator n=1 Tax=Actinomadura decatromicini TaxID=2604572 RepID=A0A5D3F4M0_9ACTN|nr:LysR family transcriptional regulator [Actinomadura decatromicini]TYK43132.1 LysR family transcriptional regulator [Actinomadura decatromicini]